MARVFRSLSAPPFRRWYAAALVSNLGAWMQATAQSWVVLTELTDGDAVAMAVTMSLQLGPQLVLMPVAGWVADRLDRRRLLQASQLAQAILAVVVGTLLLSGSAELWQLYLVAAALGVVMALDQPARQTIVSDLVDDAHLANAISLNLAAHHGARLIGPALAGLLIAGVGSGWVFVLNALSFAPLLVVLGLLPRVAPVASSPFAWRDLLGGVRYVARRADLRLVTAMMLLLGVVGMNFQLFASTMAVDFGVGSAEFGLLTSVMASGSLIGALASAARERARLRVVVVAAAGMGAGTALAALMPDFWSFAAVTVVIGLAGVTTFTTAQGYVQTSTPPELRGRVISIHFAVLAAGTPFGAPLFGWVVNELGARWALGVASALCGAACLLATVWYLRRRSARSRARELPDPLTV